MTNTVLKVKEVLPLKISKGYENEISTNIVI